MRTFEFFAKEVEGDITRVSNEKAFETYQEQMSKYWGKKRELSNLAYPQTKKSHKTDDLFDFLFEDEQKPLFDIDAKMIELGYLHQSEYGYDGTQYGYGFYETPFSKIEFWILSEFLDFISTDGANNMSYKYKISIK